MEGDSLDAKIGSLDHRQWTTVGPIGDIILWARVPGVDKNIGVR